MDPNKVAEAIESVYTGQLAKDIKSNSNYSLTGMMFGAVLGMVVASFMGKSKLIFGLTGAAVAGTAGYIISKKNK